MRGTLRTMTEYEALRGRQEAAYRELLPQHFARLQWSDAQLHADRERKLRSLLAAAKQGSAWHAARLADINPATATEDDLTSIPTMTKQDLMENFDGIVTDPRLSRSNRGALGRAGRR
jgi:phenylacetate-coenzyme A ligase PaaK-like adenylate-forming protein